MARFKISVHLNGNENAVKGVVRRMLDDAGFTEVEFQIDEVRSGPTEIRVPLKCGRTMAVGAYVFGEWAAHQWVLEYGMLSDRRWAVTHVPSGRCLQIHDTVTEDDAVNVAAALREAIPAGQMPGRPVPLTTDLEQRIINTVRGVLWP